MITHKENYYITMCQVIKSQSRHRKQDRNFSLVRNEWIRLPSRARQAERLMTVPRMNFNKLTMYILINQPCLQNSTVLEKVDIQYNSLFLPISVPIKMFKTFAEVRCRLKSRIVCPVLVCCLSLFLLAPPRKMVIPGRLCTFKSRKVNSNPGNNSKVPSSCYRKVEN